MLGVLAANGSEIQLNAAADFAANIGLAFQIRDDMLDVIGNAEELGKAVGVDTTKNTFIQLYGVENCDEMVKNHTSRAVACLNRFNNTEYMIERGGVEAVAHTVVNAIAINSGIVCDGAKASCAAKISVAVEAGLMGLSMYNKGNEFFGGDGLVKNGVESTIDTFGRLARLGMKETDEEIIRLMLED